MPNTTDNHTDLDRLHSVALGETTGRNSGKTYLTCHEICGIIELGQTKTIIAKVKYLQDLKYILPMLFRVFKEQGIEVKKFYPSQHRLVGEDFEILFLSSNNFNDRITEIEGAIVDFIDY